MNSLSLERPLVIVMVGYPGAGKSFFARQFSDTFSAPLVSFNKLRYALFTDPTYTAAERQVLNSVANFQINELFKTKKSFLIDGGFNTKADRQKLSALAKSQGYGMLLVWAQTDLATCKARSTKRNSRRIDDAETPSLSVEIFETLSKQFTPPTATESFIVISGKHNYSTQAKVLLSRLVTNRQQAGVKPPLEHQTAAIKPRTSPRIFIN